MAELRLGDNIVVPAIVIKEGAEINNQNKTITQNGQYTADEGYTGLGTVTVNVSGGGGGSMVPSFSFENMIGTVDAEGALHWARPEQGFDISFSGIRKINEDPLDIITVVPPFYFLFTGKYVKNVSFPDLVEIFAEAAFEGMFAYSDSIENIYFPSLVSATDWAFQGMFLEQIKPSSSITVHFRADAEATISQIASVRDEMIPDGINVLYDL